MLGSETTLTVEFSGASPAQYDQLHVSGNHSLGGAVSVSFINDITPSVWQVFDMFHLVNLDSAFNSLLLPTLSSGQAWNTSQLYTMGILSVAASFPPLISMPTSTAATFCCGKGVDRPIR